MSCPSPDSSTQPMGEKKRKSSGHKRKLSKKRKEKSALSSSRLNDDRNAVQNDFVNSTQEILEIKDEIKTKKDNEEIRRLKKKHAQMKKKIKYNIALLKEYETHNVNPENITKIQKQFNLLNVEDDVLGGIKPLQELVNNKKLLYKEVFKIINKKQFKQILPKNLKEFDARQVKKWCLAEIQRISKRNLIAAMNGEETELLSSDNECPEENPGKDDITENTQTAENSNINEANEGEEICIVNQHNSCQDELEVVHIGMEDKLESLEETDVQPNEKVTDAISNESAVFEEMMKTPDQDEVDKLMNCATSKSLKDLLNKNKTDLETDTVKVLHQENENRSQQESNIGDDDNEKSSEKRSLQILELELRARALKSFIEAKERHKAAKNTTQ